MVGIAWWSRACSIARNRSHRQQRFVCDQQQPPGQALLSVHWQTRHLRGAWGVRMVVSFRAEAIPKFICGFGYLGFRGMKINLRAGQAFVA